MNIVKSTKGVNPVTEKIRYAKGSFRIVCFTVDRAVTYKYIWFRRRNGGESMVFGFSLQGEGSPFHADKSYLFVRNIL